MSKMDARTREALEKSIQHWKKNAETDPWFVVLGPKECASCVLFFRDDCDGCPVYQRTGKQGCEKTPYWLAVRASRQSNLPAFKAAALEEVAFLESLREEAP